MLMAAAGQKVISVGYVCLLAFAATANVLLFGLIGAAGGSVYLLARRIGRVNP